MCVIYTGSRGNWQRDNDVVCIARTSHRRATRGHPVRTWPRGIGAKKSRCRRDARVDDPASRTGALAAHGHDSRHSGTLESVRRKSRAVPPSTRLRYIFRAIARIFFSAAEARSATKTCSARPRAPLVPVPRAVRRE